MTNPRVNLDWQWNEENKEWFADVPAELYAGHRGTWRIWFHQRPYYCDRGRWDCHVQGYYVEGPDFQERFPRYYFDLERGKAEMEEWVAVRQEAFEKVLQ